MAEVQTCSKCRQPEPTGEAVPICGSKGRVLQHLCVACVIVRWDYDRVPWARIPRRFHTTIRLAYRSWAKGRLAALRPPIGMTPRTFRKEA